MPRSRCRDNIAGCAGNAAADLDDMLVCPIMDARNNRSIRNYKPQNGLMINPSGYMGFISPNL